MRKLKLESLSVESFETSAAPSRAGGTVQGHITGSRCPSYDCPSVYQVCPADTFEPACGPTEYLDCTFGCTRVNTCNVCWIENTSACTA